MSRLLRDSTTLAQERRLAQLTDDNAFLDVQALTRQDRGSGGEFAGTPGSSGSSRGLSNVANASGVNDGGGDTALARLRGQSRVHLPSGYANQHKAYVEMWTSAWRKMEERSSSEDDSDYDDGRGASDHVVVDGRADGKRGRRLKSKLTGPKEILREGKVVGADAGADARSARKVRKLKRGETITASLRDPEAVAEALDEELRLLKTWQLVQSARCSPAALHILRTRKTTASDEKALPSLPPLLGMGDEEVVRSLRKQGRRGDIPRSLSGEVFVALLRCPSHTAMAAPPPAPLPECVDIGAHSSPVARALPLSSAGALKKTQDDGETQSKSKKPIPLASLVPSGPRAAGTAGGVHGNHLCSVCLKLASYRCVRCKNALFCSTDCHVIHDATRCLKFIV